MLLKLILIAYAFALASADTVVVTSTRDYRVGTTASQTTVLPITKNRVGSSDLNTVDPQTTAITSCHFHGATQFCIDGNGNEGSIVPVPSKTEDASSSYSGCHSHGEDTFCLSSSDEEVQFVVENDSSNTSSDPVSEATSDSGSNNLQIGFYMVGPCILLPYLI